ncbi:MAG: hypothetical protein EBR82_76620, partial [Caulobacteraceae bacterium]|nr:hypothetical protein [Caulobacteraceae bacterium]
MPLKRTIHPYHTAPDQATRKFTADVAENFDNRRVSVRFTVGAETAGVRSITAQVIDRLNREPISGRWLLRFWYATTAWGSPGGNQNTAVTTGTMVENTDEQIIEAATDDGGTLVFTVTIADPGDRYIYLANLEELASTGGVSSAGGGSYVPPTSSGGAGTVVRSGTATVNFGSPHEDGTATVTVTGQTWVTADAIITATAPAVTSADHDPDDAAVEGLTCHVG